MEKAVLKNFQADYAGLLISSGLVTIAMVEAGEQVFPRDTPFTLISGALHETGVSPHRILNGNLLVVMRNQAYGSKMSAQISGLFTVRSHPEVRPAQMTALLVEYLFMWTDKYFKDHYIKESNTVEFIFPPYLYSAASFEKDFQIKNMNSTAFNFLQSSRPLPQI